MEVTDLSANITGILFEVVGGFCVSRGRSATHKEL